MPQLSIKTESELRMPGSRGTLSDARIEGAQNNRWNRSGAAIPYGRFLVAGTDPGDVVLPSATGQRMLGVSYRNPAFTYLDATDLNAVPDDSMIDVLVEGAIMVSCEATGATIDDPVYVRHTADGLLTTIGGVAIAAGTGLDLVPGARVISSYAANPGRVMIYVNLV